MTREDNQLILLENVPEDASIDTYAPDTHPISNLMLAEHHRWVLWTPVCLGIGVGMYFSLPTEPTVFFGPVSMTVTGILSYVFRRNVAVLTAFLAVFCILSGFGAAQFRTANLNGVTLVREVGPTRVSGHVVQVEPKINGARLLLENATVAGLEPFAVPNRIRVTVRYGDATPVQPGDWINVRAVLQPPANPVAPGAFDFQRYAFFKNIGATGYGLGPPEVRMHWQQSKDRADFGGQLARLRLAIGNRIRAELSGEVGALAAALVTGERLAIPDQAVTAMRHAGLAHLLAISGLHIGLVAGLVFFLMRAGLALIPRLAIRYPIKVWAALGALTAAFGYTLLAGATIPTVRSFMMMALVLCAVMIGRRAISMRTVALAASIILLFRPESLLGPSFQLSFAAVTALVAAYEWITPRTSFFWRRAGWFQKSLAYLGGVALSTLIAGVATAPFAAFHFHQLASYGMLANLIAVPLTALCIMPTALLAIMTMPFDLDWLPLNIMGLGVEGLLWSARMVADLPGNLRQFSAMPLSALVTIALGSLWICLWYRKWRLLGIPVIVVGILLTVSATNPTIVIAENAQVISIRSEENIYIVGPGVRGNRYTQKAWLERAGHPEVMPVKTSQALRCDHMGCVLTHPTDHKISIIWEEGALIEDCWTAEILISTTPVRLRCDHPSLIIDRFDLWRNGAYAIFVDGANIDVQNTRELRGERPWTRYNDRKARVSKASAS